MRDFSLLHYALFLMLANLYLSFLYQVLRDRLHCIASSHCRILEVEERCGSELTAGRQKSFSTTTLTSVAAELFLVGNCSLLRPGSLAMRRVAMRPAHRATGPERRARAALTTPEAEPLRFLNEAGFKIALPCHCTPRRQQKRRLGKRDSRLSHDCGGHL